MSDWTYVVSKSELKAEKAAKKAMELEMANAAAKAAKKAAEFHKAVKAFKDAIASSTVDLSTIVDMNGYPKPVEMAWPTVEKKDSYILSEVRGSTKGCDLVPAYWSKYTKVVKFLSEYTVPIYDIEYEENQDMGYVCGYEGRCPYTESITLKILTFAGKNIPVVHVYTMDVDGVQAKNVECRYEYSYLPSLTPFAELEYFGDMDFEDECWIRLASLNTATTTTTKTQ